MKRKKPIPLPLEIEEIEEKGRLLRSERDIATYYLLYLTAARVSEGLQLRQKDIKGSGQHVIVDIITLKNRAEPIRRVPIAKSAVETKGAEKGMLKYVVDYIRDFSPDSQPFLNTRQRVYNHFTTHIKFPHYMRLPNKKLIQVPEFRLYPHFLRHCRLTHMVTHYGLSAFELVQYAGWTDPSPAMTYVSLNWKDLARKIK